MNYIKLLNYSFYHILLILIPIVFFGLLAIKKGEKNKLIILSIGAVGGGMIAYAIFWISLVSSTTGMIASISIYILMAILCATWLRKSFDSEIVASLVRPVVVWIFYSVFILSAGFAPSDLSQPLNAAAIRFSHSLPMDNQLPLMFADQILKGKVLSPMIAEWLSSDRPPLQTAYFLFSGAGIFANLEWHYQVLSTLLQCLWVIALWVLLENFKIARLPLSMAILIPMYSGVTLVNSVFVWPKLLPVFYLVLLVGILSIRKEEIKSNLLNGYLVGVLSALAMLSHGGSVFALLGIGLTLLLKRRLPNTAIIICSLVSGIAILTTWSFYQGYIDPPGNRLLKWHLAGVIPVDERTLKDALIQSYHSLTFSDVVNLKLSNLYSVFGNPIQFLNNLFIALFKTTIPSEMNKLRAAQFFSVWAASGVMALVAISVIFAPFYKKSNEKEVGLFFMQITFCIILVWIIILFGPAYTVIHTGSLAMMIFLLSGVILYCYSIHKVLAIGLAMLHFYITYKLYCSYGWSRQNGEINLPFMLIALISFCVSIMPFMALPKTGLIRQAL
jgi:hypothetical protein